MKKLSIILTFLALVSNVYSQKYLTQTGRISFFSSSPMEDIEAINNQVSSVINMENGEMAFSLLMKAFSFEKALMQEHFNEKYVESDKYPKASFKGKIENFDQFKLSDKTQEVTISGTLTIHGISKEITVKGTLMRSGENKISGKSIFNIELDDFEIEIPGTVKDNINNTIKLTIQMNYDKLE